MVGWNKILLGKQINDPMYIMYTDTCKQWPRYTKFHLKNVQEGEINILLGLCPFIVCLLCNKMHKAKVCKSYDMIALNEMSFI